MNKVEGSLISVIIPVYNVEKYIRECLDSLINQTYENLEIIVVDDGATDNSGKICDEYAAKDSRIKVIHQENGGISSARNTGLDVAKGEYIGFIDSDDYIDKEFYEKLYEAAKITGYDVVGCGVRLVDENGGFMEDVKPVYEDKITVLSEREQWMLMHKSLIGTVVWNKIFKREVFAKIRYHKGRVHEDEGIDNKIYKEQKQVAYIKDILLNYRQRQGSVMNQGFQLKHLDKSEFYLERLHYFIEKGYNEMYFEAFGEGTRILLRGLGKFSEDKEVKKIIMKQYAGYRKAAKQMLKSGVSISERARLRLFIFNINLYRFVRNITRKNKL